MTLVSFGMDVLSQLLNLAAAFPKIICCIQVGTPL